MSFRRSVLARMTSQKPGRPQFVGVPEVLRLAARQRYEPSLGLPSLGLERDPRFPARTRTIFERRHRTLHHGPLDAALDRLVVQPQRPADREKRRIFPIGEQYSRPFNPTRRLGPRLRDRPQLSRILVSQRQLDRPTPRRHKFNPAPLWTDAALCRNPKTQNESFRYDEVHGIGRLGRFLNYPNRYLS